MRRNNASIIVCPVPVGALNPMDKRLQTNNPISLTGSLDPNSASAAGNQSATQVHIGDYAKDGKTLNAMQDIRDVYHGVSLDTTGFDNDTNASRISGHELSSKFAELFGFGDMNHPVDYQNATTFETAGRLINTMCFHTMQKFQNPANGRWEVTNLNTGHFGENGIYEGVKKIRCGFLDYFKDMEYQKSMAHGGLNI